MSLGQNLQRASQLLQQRQYAEALATLQSLAGGHPTSADVWQLTALAHKGLNDPLAAEQAFLRSIDLGAQPHVVTNLGNLYRSLGRAGEALARYDQALGVAPDHLPAQVNRGRALLDLQRYADAASAFRTILGNHPGHRNASLGLAQACQQLGEQEAALGLFESVLEQDAGDSVALNGMGISMKTLGYADDAVDYLLRGAERAPDAPEIAINLASALAQADRQEEAVAAYRKALELSPDNVSLHDWYNGYLGVIGHSDYLASYRSALARQPGNTALAVSLARKLLLGNCGAEALTVLAAVRGQVNDTTAIDDEISQVHREQGEFAEALAAARRAAAGAPEDAAVMRELATALMAAGDDYAEARALLDGLLRDHPEDQGLWALMSTALRYTGDGDRYRALVDYDRLIQVREIQPPPEFPDSGSFVAYLRDQLDVLHTTQRHPVEQSAVNGTQTLDDLFSRRHEGIGRLKAGLTEQLQRVIDGLPRDDRHPLLSRNRGGLRFSDSWSIKLHEQGFHKNHFHSQGWLSSAFYLSVPDAINCHSPEGWIKFGEPGFRAREPLPAEYWIRPREGLLVVFPSYLWHGTEPLCEARARMSVGYDILPAR